MDKKDEKELLYEYCFLSERHIFYVAILIIVLVGVLLIIYFPNNEQLGQALLTAILTWISAIVGFYFGQKPIRDIINRLQEKEKVYYDKVNTANNAMEEAYKIYHTGKKLEQLLIETQKKKTK